ncbi:S8 family peptidase [Haliangium ochraceum]|uniref:Peptidase S8 and S53 subtilisin kexin sedolisin n=1 Tax=Haliangium ochraceum (strain DSM 14365 / JCM 11303 / SMP-2) TaxID=502025 RepID=D0LXP2_HALO1|nr:S8 family peptidase [Haliangium ochraceum]ACY17797.1 peptidase S8 and S53 subtilisin kexin sedolisin [Haliangium ochraceum DSM 14365]
MHKLFSFAVLPAAGAAALLLASGCQTDTSAWETEQAEEALVQSRAGEAIAGKYIIVLKDGTMQMSASSDYATRQGHARSAAASVLARHGLPEAAIDHAYGNALQGFSARLSAQEAKALAADPAVAILEQDRIIELFAPPGCHPKKGCDDGGGDGGGGSQNTPYGITRVGGGNGPGSGTAWVIDTGIDLDHEDLNVDVSRAADFVGGSGDDGNGHGTHVAGTIAALDNGLGVIGVAPGAPVVPVRVLDNRGSGTTSGVIAGVDYVAANASNGDVANMSLGGGVSSALDSAVVNCAQSGVKIALAAGNSSTDANNSSPARANGANIYTVSAIDSNDNFASFSNFGNPPVDFAAPGVAVESTYKSNGYASLSGTSMAAPHVAGLLLLGSVRSDGNANGDPDGNPDPIAHN